MRIKLFHHGSEWLPDDVEPPPALAREGFLTAFGVRRSPDGSLLGAKLSKGSALWDAAGKLLYYDDRAGDVHLGTGENALLVLDNTFGRCTTRSGIRHRVRRLELGTLRLLAEAELCVPIGGVERLIVDHRQATALATFLDQHQWGYVSLDLATLQQAQPSLYARGATLSPPAFSPDDELVVAVHYLRELWWSDDPDDWYAPSPGGPHQMGSISVHQLATDKVTFHEVWIDLPEGWLPDRPENSEWSNLWGPEFLSRDSFKIWLPDDTEEPLTLPLPDRITIRRPLGTTRTWDDGA